MRKVKKRLNTTQYFSSTLRSLHRFTFHLEMTLDVADLLNYTKQAWSEGGFALEGLKSMIRVPNLSPACDPEFHTNGLIHKAIETTKNWIESQGVKGLTTKVYNDTGREPLLTVNIDGYKPDAPYVLTYGHLDKMPHLNPKGWSEGLAATNPVVRGENLYGRGANDDNYNPFLILSSFKYLQEKGLPYPRMMMILETGEESGDEEITRYFTELKEVIGNPGFIFILDGACMDYNTFWSCVSLRGVINGSLTVSHLATPCHSGMATGLVPSTFRIARQLLSRIEDEKTGEILLKEANLPEIPAARVEATRKCAEVYGAHAADVCTLLPGSKLLTDDLTELLLKNTLKPGLAVTGADGIPSIQDGSNVMRPTTALKISLRIPPGIDATTAAEALKKELERDPPYGAKVEYKVSGAGTGWSNSEFQPKLAQALNTASNSVFNREPLFYGEGASIPLCSFLKKLWPQADIMVTGAAGPDANPHGYDELLNLTYTAKFGAAFSIILSEYAK
ncbi:Clan MH, family M20, peptidase T-like metallopeptidase [Tritrichomonas foetus]|uniref:Clan MH, family M20, peptidase T-like metallopeptidase n=1 Tax=Tritrichomonas foetus TaxID=1144522 RepID=A0A1J4KAC7_9EUKA|nr:Clan MH, family M20, peptidase T-like metallopeptidase [Tritrichomonas foetus]|eukprot:OHT07864.1 Clan MH, family M20, peptidase T-like metallopeptidase [Tritrichomonas foetus]